MLEKTNVRRAGSRLGRMPLTKIGKSAGTSMSVPIDITDDTLASSSLAPPATIYGNRVQIDEKPKITSFTSIEMVHTHAPQQRGFFGRRQLVLNKSPIVSKGQELYKF